MHPMHPMCPIRPRAGFVPKEATAELLAEVGHLVESPRVVSGGFDPKFLKLPK